MNAPLCPSAHELESLVLGRVPKETLDGLVNHFSECPSCFAKVQTLSPSADTLTTSLVGAKSVSQETPDPAVSQLIEKLARQRAPKTDLRGVGAEDSRLAGTPLSSFESLSLTTNGFPPLPVGEIATKVNPQNLPFREKADPTDALAPPQSPDELGRIGDYRVSKVLGIGGMGTVFLAEDAQLGRKAAIKAMRPELAARPENRVRFLREARAAAAIEHDNVVPIWQVGQADGTPFIVMPFLQGESLECRLQRGPVQPTALLLEMARDLAEGLAAAHAKGLMHRDIKPANIWVEGDPEAKELSKQVRRCKILDFGLARAAKEDANLTAWERFWARRRTWPRSRRAARRWITEPTCSRSVACCIG